MAADVADLVLDDADLVVLARRPRRRSRARPRADGRASTPLSTMQTSTAPREPPIAHSRSIARSQRGRCLEGRGVARREAPGGDGMRAHPAARATSRAAVAARCACRRGSSVVVRAGREVDLDEPAAAVAAASASVAAAHASPTHRLGSLARRERRERRDVGRGLGDLEGHAARRGAAPRRARRRARARRAARARARRRGGRRPRAAARGLRARRPGRRSPAPRPSRAETRATSRTRPAAIVVASAAAEPPAGPRPGLGEHLVEPAQRDAGELDAARRRGHSSSRVRRWATTVGVGSTPSARSTRLEVRDRLRTQQLVVLDPLPRASRARDAQQAAASPPRPTPSGARAARAAARPGVPRVSPSRPPTHPTR